MSTNEATLRLMKPGGIPYDIPPKRPLSIDGIVARQRAPAARAAAPRPQTVRVVSDVVPRPRPQPAVPVAAPVPISASVQTDSQPVYRVDSDDPRPNRFKRFLVRPALRGLMVVAAIIIGTLLSGMVQLGGLAIAAYAACALFFPIKSERTFGLALISLIATVVLLVVSGDGVEAKNFATYTFLLMATGVITLTVELRPRLKLPFR